MNQDDDQHVNAGSVQHSLPLCVADSTVDASRNTCSRQAHHITVSSLEVKKGMLIADLRELAMHT